MLRCLSAVAAELEQLRARVGAVARGERGQRWKTAPTGGPHLSVRGRECVFFNIRNI